MKNVLIMVMGLHRFYRATELLAKANIRRIEAKYAASVLRRNRGSANSLLMQISDNSQCPVIKHN